MSDQKPASSPATQKLAELVARRKASGEAAAGGKPGQGLKGAERAAAARSASKSKPALRK